MWIAPILAWYAIGGCVTAITVPIMRRHVKTQMEMERMFDAIYSNPQKYTYWTFWRLMELTQVHNRDLAWQVLDACVDAGILYMRECDGITYYYK